MKQRPPKKKSLQEGFIFAILFGITIAFTSIAIASIASATLANAEQLMRREAFLKSHVTVDSHVVTLGDLFSNVGEKSNIAVFRSPTLGKEGYVSLSRIAEAANRHDLIWSNPAQIQSLTVSRPGRTIHQSLIKQVLLSHLKKRFALQGNHQLTLRNKRINWVVPAHVKTPLEIVDFSYSPGSGLLKARLAPGLNQPTEFWYSVSGYVEEFLELTVPARVIAKGEIINTADLTKIKITKRLAPKRVASASEIIGRSAKRRLLASKPILLTDTEDPKLVKKNQLVTIILKTSIMTLKTQGQALSDGIRGEVVRVKNLKSEKIIHASVAGDGLVVVKKGTLGPLSAVIKSHSNKSQL